MTPTRLAQARNNDVDYSDPKYHTVSGKTIKRKLSCLRCIEKAEVSFILLERDISCFKCRLVVDCPSCGFHYDEIDDFMLMGADILGDRNLDEFLFANRYCEWKKQQMQIIEAEEEKEAKIIEEENKKQYEKERRARAIRDTFIKKKLAGRSEDTLYGLEDVLLYMDKRFMCASAWIDRDNSIYLLLETDRFHGKREKAEYRKSYRISSVNKVDGDYLCIVTKKEVDNIIEKFKKDSEHYFDYEMTLLEKLFYRLFR